MKASLQYASFDTKFVQIAQHQEPWRPPEVSSITQPFNAHFCHQRRHCLDPPPRPNFEWLSRAEFLSDLHALRAGGVPWGLVFFIARGSPHRRYFLELPFWPKCDGVMGYALPHLRFEHTDFKWTVFGGYRSNRLHTWPHCAHGCRTCLGGSPRWWRHPSVCVVEQKPSASPTWEMEKSTSPVLRLAVFAGLPRAEFLGWKGAVCC